MNSLRAAKNLRSFRRASEKLLPRHCAQRGIYLTFGDACVIISACKAILRHQMCPKRLPEEHQTNVPFVRRRHLWRVGPSTRGATAPQRAQQVNFVRRRCVFNQGPSPQKSIHRIEKPSLAVGNSSIPKGKIAFACPISYGLGIYSNLEVSLLP